MISNPSGGGDGGGNKPLKSIFDEYLREDKSGKGKGNKSFLSRIQGLSKKGFGSLKGLGAAALSKLDEKFGISDKIGKLKDLEGKIKDAIAKGYKLLPADLNKLISGALNNVFGDLNIDVNSILGSTIDAAYNAGLDILKSAVDGLSGLLLSRINMPEIAYLASLKGMYLAYSDINYKNEYIRKMCLKRDLAEVIAWIDEENGKIYNYNESTDISDGLTAAKNGALTVAEYIANFFYKDARDLKNLVDDLERKVELEEKFKAECFASKKSYPKDRKRLLEKLDREYQEIKKEYRNAICAVISVVKAIIVYSYSQLDVDRLDRILKKYNLRPSLFGESDKEYGALFKISDFEIDKMAPFFNPPSSQSTIKSFEKKFNQNAFVKRSKKRSNTKLIAPNNRNIKHLYLYLESTFRHEGDAIYHPKLYQRLRYPIYTSAVKTLDKACAGLVNSGIGKAVFDIANKASADITSACYDFTKSVENMLYDPKRVQYISTDGVTLPEPKRPVVNNTKNKQNKPVLDPKTGKFITPDGIIIELPPNVKPVFDPVTGRWIDPIKRQPIPGDWNYPAVPKPIKNKDGIYCDPITGVPIPGEWNDGSPDRHVFYDYNICRWIDPLSKEAIILSSDFNNGFNIPTVSPYRENGNGLWIDPVTKKPIEASWNVLNSKYVPYLDKILGKWIDPISKLPLEGDWNKPMGRPKPLFKDGRWFDPILDVPLPGDWNEVGSGKNPVYNIDRGVWLAPDGSIIQMVGNIEVFKPIFSLRMGQWIDPITKKPLIKQPKPPTGGMLPKLVPNADGKLIWVDPISNLRIDDTGQTIVIYPFSSNIGEVVGWNDPKVNGKYAPMFDKNTSLWCHPIPNYKPIDGAWNKPVSPKSSTRYEDDVWVLGYDTIFDIDDNYWEAFKQQYPGAVGTFNPDDPRSAIEQMNSLGKINRNRKFNPEDMSDIDESLFGEDDINIDEYIEKMRSDFCPSGSCQEYLLLDLSSMGMPRPPRRGRPIFVNDSYWCDSYVLESIMFHGGKNVYGAKTLEEFIEYIKHNYVPGSGVVSPWNEALLPKGPKPSNFSIEEWEKEPNWVYDKDAIVYMNKEGIWCNKYGPIAGLTNNNRSSLSHIPFIKIEEDKPVYYTKHLNLTEDDIVEEKIYYFDTTKPYDSEIEYDGKTFRNKDCDLWTKPEDSHPLKEYQGFFVER